MDPLYETTTVQRPTLPAGADLPTPKQVEFALSLLRDWLPEVMRNTAGVESTREEIIEKQRRHMETGGMTRRQASEFIDGLLKSLREMRAEQAAERRTATATGEQRARTETTTTPAPTGAAIPNGRYALRGEDGMVRFYKVTAGRNPGVLFVDQITGNTGEWGAKVGNPVTRARVLEAIKADIAEAARLYGAEIGRCSRCNRLLTNEESRALGIGPECRSRG